jgi:hypothetical protein
MIQVSINDSSHKSFFHIVAIIVNVFGDLQLLPASGVLRINCPQE